MLSRPASQSRTAAYLATCLALVACAGPAKRSPAPTSPLPAPVERRSPAAAMPAHERAAVIAVRQIGIPYRYGGASRDGFDCSGLVYYAYGRVGKRLPRTTRTLWDELRPVARDELRVGDVLFFRIEGKVSHVGLYLGKGRFVHAPASGREVTVAALDTPFYRQAYLRGGRP